MANPQLRIRRGGESFGSILSMKVVLDGVEIGLVPPPAPCEKAFTLPGSGSYSALFRINRCSSSVLKFKIGNDETICLRAVLPEFPVFSQIFRRKNYGYFVVERQLPDRT